jgi:hypothetical protein
MVRQPVTLLDPVFQIDPNRTFDIRRRRTLHTPAVMDGISQADAATHLMAYDIKQTTRNRTRWEISVSDRFGQFTALTSKPDRLLVPTALDLDSEIENPLDPSDHDVNHFVCYRVKGVDGFEDVFGIGVDTLFDDRLYKLQKVNRVCNPVGVNGEPIKDPSQHMVCYKAKRDRRQERHERAIANTHDELGPSEFLTSREEELCVPATVQVN